MALWIYIYSAFSVIICCCFQGSLPPPPPPPHLVLHRPLLVTPQLLLWRRLLLLSQCCGLFHLLVVLFYWFYWWGYVPGRNLKVRHRFLNFKHTVTFFVWVFCDSCFQCCTLQNYSFIVLIWIFIILEFVFEYISFFCHPVSCFLMQKKKTNTIWSHLCFTPSICLFKVINICIKRFSFLLFSFLRYWFVTSLLSSERIRRCWLWTNSYQTKHNKRYNGFCFNIKHISCVPIMKKNCPWCKLILVKWRIFEIILDQKRLKLHL